MFVTLKRRELHLLNRRDFGADNTLKETFWRGDPGGAEKYTGQGPLQGLDYGSHIEASTLSSFSRSYNTMMYVITITISSTVLARAACLVML